MGMSASQARLLNLQARQSNLEYQGQQINQERTILSQQCTALYNSLLSMTVPTPPATTDYQTVQYTGTLGATSYTFDANSVKPNGDYYTITMQEQKYGDSLQKNTTIATVDLNSSGTFKGIQMDPTTQIIKEGETYSTGNYVADTTGSKYMVPVEVQQDTDGNYYLPAGTYYSQSGSTYSVFEGTVDANTKVYTLSSTAQTGAQAVKAETAQAPSSTSTEGALITKSDMASIYVLDNGQVRASELSDFDTVAGQSNALRLKTDGSVTYIQESDSSNAKTYTEKGNKEGISVAGKGIHKLTSEEKEKYTEAIANSGIKDASGNAYGVNDFYIYYDDKDSAVFVLVSDVEDGNNNATTYSYTANGEYTKNATYDDAQLTFDPTNGRITEVAIPNYNDDGSVASWTAITVSAETVTDEDAYNDAYAQYEYDTYLYDQENKKINAKTEVIQQEDKNLELKLQRLDDERTQITTEIEAVEKVIDDNIEASYKTFSG